MDNTRTGREFALGTAQNIPTSTDTLLIYGMATIAGLHYRTDGRGMPHVGVPFMSLVHGPSVLWHRCPDVATFQGLGY